MAVLLGRVLPDELVFYAKYRYRFSKVITGVLRTVVSSESQSGAVRILQIRHLLWSQLPLAL